MIRTRNDQSTNQTVQTAMGEWRSGTGTACGVRASPAAPRTLNQLRWALKLQAMSVMLSAKCFGGHAGTAQRLRNRNATSKLQSLMQYLCLDSTLFQRPYILRVKFIPEL